MSRIPRISILLPVYNAAPFLGEAIDSLLTQTFKDFELVIVNDGSTDDSDAIIRTYHDPRIRYFSLPENKGRSFADNYAFRECKGELIAKMDADDIALPGRLSLQVAYLDAHPDIDLVGSRVRYFGDISSHAEYVFKEPAHTLCSNFFGMPTFNQTILIRREAMERLRLKYDDSLPSALAEDAVFFADAFPHLAVGNINKVLVLMRRLSEVEGPKRDERHAMRVANCRRAYQSIVDKYGIAYSNTELELHFKLGQPRGFTTEDLSALEAWFHRIVTHNNEVRLFSPDALHQVLSHRMFLVCYHTARPYAWRFFLSSAFRATSLVPGSLKAKLLPKMIINIIRG